MYGPITELSHKTDKRRIEKMTKDKLRGLLWTPGGQFDDSDLRRMKKPELVDLAFVRIDELKAEHEQAEDSRKAERLARLDAEQKDPNCLQVINKTVEALRNKQEEYRKTLEAFQAKVSENLLDISYQIEWYGERVLYSQAVLQKTEPIVQYFQDQSAERSDLLDEMEQLIQEDIENLRRRILYRDGYRQCSTSAMANFKAMAEFKAEQKVHAILEAALKLFRGLRANDDWAANCPIIREKAY